MSEFPMEAEVMCPTCKGTFGNPKFERNEGLIVLCVNCGAILIFTSETTVQKFDLSMLPAGYELPEDMIDEQLRIRTAA